VLRGSDILVSNCPFKSGKLGLDEYVYEYDKRVLNELFSLYIHFPYGYTTRNYCEKISKSKSCP
jgi:hypothetical protein